MQVITCCWLNIADTELFISQWLGFAIEHEMLVDQLVIVLVTLQGTFIEQGDIVVVLWRPENRRQRCGEHGLWAAATKLAGLNLFYFMSSLDSC